jgi:hypothetical protein
MATFSHELDDLTDDAIISEIGKRGLECKVVERMTEENFFESVGAAALIGANLTRLVHEIRRQATGISIESYYYKPKQNISPLPHCTDEIGAEIVQLIYKGRNKTTGDAWFTPLNPEGRKEHKK